MDGRGTAFPYLAGMNTIVETKAFTGSAVEFWTLDEYEDFKVFIVMNPDAGVIVPGSGGLRKIRWRNQGTGKRGGTRVIYYNRKKYETWLLAIYSKSDMENLTKAEIRSLRRVVDE